MRAVATWAFVGGAVGAWLGLADAALARAGSLHADPGVFPVAVLLDGAVGVVVGLLVVLLVRRVPIGPVGPALLAAAGVAVGFAAPLVLSARSDAPVRPGDPPTLFPNLLVVTVPGLADAVAAGRSPAWSHLAPTAVRFPGALAAVSDPEPALAGLLAARLPPGLAAAPEPTLLGLGGAVGYRTLVVVPEDRTDAVALAPDAGAWRTASDPDPLRVGRASAGLALGGVLGPRLGRAPRPATPERAASLAGTWMAEQAGHAWIAVVQLPAGDAGSVQAALVGLVAAAEAASGGRPLGLLVVGQPSGPGLAAADLATPGLVRLPDGRYGGVVVRGPVPAVDLGETVRRWLPGSDVPADGTAWADVRLAKAAVAVSYEADLALAASGGDPGRACKLLYPDEAVLPVVGVAADGVARVARNGGYALFVDASGQRLVDEVADPGAPRDLLAEGATTCQDRPAAERARSLAEGLDAVLAASRERAATTAR